MNETELLVNRIKEGIQEKKGKRITIVDMTNIESICSYFVICEGTSNTQIMAITDSIEDYVRKTTGEKPIATDGLGNATWIAMDYGDVIVHIFEPASRTYYNLEHLWSDAILTDIPDLV
jgi:ribosome-associated protein